MCLKGAYSMRILKECFRKIAVFSVILALFAAPVTCVRADAVNPESASTKEAQEDIVKIEALGIRPVYATGEAICFTAKVTNTSDKPIYVENYNSKNGSTGSIGVYIKTKDQKYIFAGNEKDFVSDGIKYLGELKPGESIERDYTFYNTTTLSKCCNMETGEFYREFALDIMFEYSEMSQNEPAPFGAAITKSFDFEVGDVPAMPNVTFLEEEFVFTGEIGDNNFIRPVARYIKTDEGLLFWIVKLKQECNNYDDEVYAAVCAVNISDEPKTIFSDYNLSDYDCLDERGYIICDVESQDKTIKLEEDLSKYQNPTGNRYTKELKPGESVSIRFRTSTNNVKAGQYTMHANLNCLNSENEPEIVTVSIPMKINDVQNSHDGNTGETPQDKFKGKLYGDFDLDGEVTLNDAKKALRLSLGIDTATEDEAYLGNLNGRGITLNEAKAFLRMSLGIDKTKQI